MAIQREFYGERADGVKLYRTFSDGGKVIRQNETGIPFDEAVDVEDAAFTYSETDTEIRNGNENTRKETTNGTD